MHPYSQYKAVVVYFRIVQIKLEFQRFNLIFPLHRLKSIRTYYIMEAEIIILKIYRYKKQYIQVYSSSNKHIIVKRYHFC